MSKKKKDGANGEMRQPEDMLSFDELKDRVQAGEEAEGKTPLTQYSESDVEPNGVFQAEGR